MFNYCYEIVFAIYDRNLRVWRYIEYKVNINIWYCIYVK